MRPCVFATDLKPPGSHQSVYREDCTQCFDSVVRCCRYRPLLLHFVASITDKCLFCKDDESGLNVCLHCFNGGCTGDRNHGLLHYQHFGHPLALNIKRTEKKRKVCIGDFYFLLVLLLLRIRIGLPFQRANQTPCLVG